MYQTTLNIKKSEYGSVKAWAEAKGFNPVMVRQEITGKGTKHYGRAGIGKAGEIVNALKEDGFWYERD